MSDRRLSKIGLALGAVALVLASVSLAVAISRDPESAARTAIEQATTTTVELVQVPDLKNVNEAEARRRILAAGLVPKLDQSEGSRNAAGIPGQVVMVSPVGSVPRGTTVNFAIARRLPD